MRRLALDGVVPLALAFGWWPGIIPRRLLAAPCWIGGGLLVLYGLGDMVRAALVVGGAIDVTGPADRDAAVWYLFLWGPVWVTGGLCFLATALFHRQALPRP